MPKLYKFVESGDWDKIPQRCKTNPREAQFVHYYPPSDTALHRILRSSAGSLKVMECGIQNRIQQLKLNAVSALLKAHRMASSIRDTFGRTPLHIACMDIYVPTEGDYDHSGEEIHVNCGEAVVSMILEAHRRAASVQDFEGRTPLHYLVGRNDTIPLDLLSKMIAAFPNALMIQDRVGETPLKIVQERGKEINICDHVIAMLQAKEEHHQKLGTHMINEDLSDDETTLSVMGQSSESFHGKCSIERPNEGNVRAATV